MDEKKLEKILYKYTSESTNYADKLAGLGKNLWKGIDPLEYTKQERKGWKKVSFYHRQDFWKN